MVKLVCAGDGCAFRNRILTNQMTCSRKRTGIAGGLQSGLRQNLQREVSLPPGASDISSDIEPEKPANGS